MNKTYKKEKKKLDPLKLCVFFFLLCIVIEMLCHYCCISINYVNFESFDLSFKQWCVGTSFKKLYFNKVIITSSILSYSILVYYQCIVLDMIVFIPVLDTHRILIECALANICFLMFVIFEFIMISLYLWHKKYRMLWK